MGITLGKKQLNKGRVSLYLNYSYNGKRRKEYLGIILDAPTSAERRAENRNKVLIARQIRAKKELEFLSVEYHLNDIENTFDDILPTDKSNVPDFYILIGQYLDTYHKKDKKMVRACITHLRLFTRKKSLPVTLLTKDFCINFLEYLRDHLRGNTPIGYFKKFRMCINKCIEKKLMTSNPTDGIRLMQFDEVTKAILSLKEIQKLAITPCPNNEVKRAFLFSCYCGLRWCDVHQLQYKDIDFSSNRLTILQQKVQSHSKNAILHLNLNHTAIKLLQRHKGINEELVFGLPSYSYTLRILNKWVKRANIHKHITFHCARHSFITNIMANGANIKTAASLAGHSTTRHTEKYVHIIDELKQKAVDSLYIKKNVDVYITGSNAYLLSGELATLLSGRYVEIKMLPLSFKEYLSAFENKEKSRYEYFLDYMKNGGMPGNIPILQDNPNDLDTYLEGIFTTIVYKDIITRNNITDRMILESVLKFIFDSIGSPISTKK